MSRALRDVRACREALAGLPELELRELRQQWRALYKSEASPHLSRKLLLRAVAYRLQEVALGGLRPAVARKITGTPWLGPLFFGLKQKRPATQSPSQIAYAPDEPLESSNAAG